MKVFTRLMLAAIGTAFGVPAVGGAPPANPAANPQARAVLAYFQGLGGRSEKRLVSGQFTDFGNGASLGLLADIHQQTGHWPALLGADYADFGTGGLTWQVPNRTAIAWWKQGGLVTLSAHLYDPANPSGGGLRDHGVDLTQLLTPGTETYTRWRQELDQLAAGLGELQQAGVVVLWRPFHEMNGGWFWWGAQDPATFTKVWQQMFTYFSQTKKLDNLLWVYSPNHGPKTVAYYPGDGYVDLVGLDAYTDFVDPAHIKGYNEVARLGKPFGFTEFGPHGPQNPPGDYDYLRFLQGVKQHFPQAVFFMCWNWKWSLGRNQHTQQLLSNPWLVNREDLPRTF